MRKIRLLLAAATLIPIGALTWLGFVSSSRIAMWKASGGGKLSTWLRGA